MAWVLHDPLVSYLTPALFLLARGGQIHLSENEYQVTIDSYYNNKARWVKREYRLRAILDLFYREGITVIPLKGGILQSQLYRDCGLRSMTDIDILVPTKDLLSAARLLVQNGMKYHPSDGVESLTELENIPIQRWPGEFTFSDGQGFAVDLHHNFVTYHWFFPAYPFEMETVWKRSISLSDEEQSQSRYGNRLWKRILSPYDMLAHLSLHLALHGLKAKQTYLDIDLWIRNLPEDWDWNQFSLIVDQWRIRSVTYHALLICRYLMDTPFPDEILQRLDPGWLARYRVRKLITAESILADRYSLGKRYPTLVKLALIDRLSDILITLKKLAFPYETWSAHDPSRRSLLAHWLHIWEVIKRGI